MIRLTDLLKETSTDLNLIANNIARQVNCNIKGSCVGFAELLVIAVYKTNPALLKDFKVIEGYVIENGRKLQHTWVRTLSGENIDPTFAQFAPGSEYDKKIKKEYTGQKYFEDTVRFNNLNINDIDTSRMTIGKWFK
jgi:hypothetical protein